MPTSAPGVIALSEVTASLYDPICGITRTKIDHDHHEPPAARG